MPTPLSSPTQMPVLYTESGLPIGGRSAATKRGAKALLTATTALNRPRAVPGETGIQVRMEAHR